MMAVAMISEILVNDLVRAAESYERDAREQSSHENAPYWLSMAERCRQLAMMLKEELQGAPKSGK
jgi:hypothetical protein